MIRWHKSSYSNGGSEDCVEVAETPETCLVRDTKQRGAGPILTFATPAWTDFLRSLKRDI
ncbi:DUF397 domain-containing protein [Pseudonocardia spinosispora]|uniref:DUF397 domain-containing protein n=1 Tax=Pseudonocardia spinosispora TaxID=103441 RepID=UPI00041D73E0|nr:DUF397 domain-containing protein [Pseudonocardia spinosispora]